MNIEQIQKNWGRPLTEEEIEIFEYFEMASKNEEIIREAEGIMYEVYMPKILAASRKRAGFTQERLAEIINCETSKIGKAETGRLKIIYIDFLIPWMQASKAQDVIVGICYGNVGMIAIMKRFERQGIIIN